MINKCKYAKEVSPVSNECGLGLYAAKIAKSSCELCVKKGFNDPIKHKEAHDELRKTSQARASRIKALLAKDRSDPSLSALVGSATTAVTNWVSGGFKTTPKKVLEERIKICEGCEMWDPKGFRNTGRCRKCGCSTWAKLRMNSAKCPLKKW